MAKKNAASDKPMTVTKGKGKKKMAKKAGKRPSVLNRLATATVAALVVGSVVQELRKPIDKRTWEGRIVGVPYDYRAPTAERLRSTWWAPEDTRVLVPTAFGLGWDLNVGRVLRLAEQTWAEVESRAQV